MSNELRLQAALLSTALLFLLAAVFFQAKMVETPTALEDLTFSDGSARAESGVISVEGEPQPGPTPEQTPSAEALPRAEPETETSY